MSPADLATQAALAASLLIAGRTACCRGDFSAAEALLRRAVAAAPSCCAAYVDLGVVLADQDRHHEAVACYLRALGLDPASALAHFNLGNSLRALGQGKEALLHYQQALELDSALNKARIYLAVALRDQQRLPEAVEAIRQALDQAPADAEAWHYYGEIRQSCGEFALAIEAYEREMSLVPAQARTLNLQGTCYQCLERYDEAIAVYHRALELEPGHRPTLNNLGTSLQAVGRLDEAIASLRELLAAAPDYADANWNLALCLLTRGEYREGWEAFEWRWRKNLPVTVRYCPAPLWDGTPLTGKTILLQGEQGFGDTFQFVRYAPLVAAAGGRVILECQAATLKPLLATAPGVAEVIDRDAPLPDCDYRMPLLSLPRLFDTTSNTIPATVPYLFADPTRVAAWGALLGGGDQLRIGLVWSGRQELQRNRKRSCTLADLAPLAPIQGVTFYSLQVGPGREQAAQPPAGMKLIDLTDRLHDFADTAAFMANLDLVITIDTAVAHLAGALGKPTWTLLPYAPDWRWFLDRDDSPWYPTMRLFRQEKPGDWSEVGAQLAAALQQALAEATGARADKFSLEGERLCSDDPLRAADLFRQALVWRPTTPKLHNNLGVALQSVGQLPAAELAYRAACRLNRAYDLALYNLGFLLDETGRFEEAEACYRQGLAANPANGGLHFNLSHLLLRLGNFAEGLKEYEWRWSTPDFNDRRPNLPSPVWDGTPLAGRTILLTLEQGFGDTIQFIRYAQLLADQGGRVIVAAPPSLMSLLACADGVAQVVAVTDQPPPHDCHAPLLSLPLLCGTTPATIPGQVPYLIVPPERQSLWRIGQDDNFRIGLVWHGGQYPANNRKRSLPLALFASLASIPGLSFYSLQLGPGQQQATGLPAGMKLIDLTERIHDFADTAALIANLDLVITIDTAVAHLAGALGRPVWTLLPLVADWRWLLNRDDSPWYPTMRLFRQHQADDWAQVIERINTALLFELMKKRHAGQEWEAAVHYSRALLAKQPGHLAATLHLGDALHRLGRFAEALEVYDQTPGHGVELDNNRGNTLLALGRHEEAIAAYRRVLLARPDFAEAHVTIGTALQALGRPREAIDEYRQALTQAPELAEAHWNLALVLLLLDDYEQGWQEYEWRWQKRGFTSPCRDFPQPLWDGSPLAGQTILLHGEQGFGDTLQFARYAPLVANRGGRVIVECHPALVRLLRCLPGVAQVCAFGDQLPDFAFQAPLMSLPGIFGTTLATIPADPYLQPSLQLSKLWQQRVGTASGLRVGLAWAGRAYPDPNRTCPLAQFTPLAGLSGMNFFSLQVETEAARLSVKPDGLVLQDLTPFVADFADTAALIANLDLVITIDTAVAHLAGALGKPTWLLLPFAPDWRWGLERQESPWYPSMRLFRQGQPGNWSPVLEAVALALRQATEDEADRLERAIQLHEAGKFPAARSMYDAILADHPHDPDANYLRGTLALQQGAIAEAEGFLRRAVIANPHVAAFHNHLGLALQRQERVDEAEEQFATALACTGAKGDAWINMGVLQRERSRPAEARSCFQQALTIDENDAKAWQNLGVTEQMLGHLDAADAAYRKALACAPDYATARWNLALLQLLQGNYREGFLDFDTRFRKSEPVKQRHTAMRRWDGREPLAGKRLLVHAEQGFGDTIQFVRYLPLLAGQVGTIFFECQGPELSSLMGTVPGVASVFARGESVPVCDLQVPLLSLPGIFDTTIETIPAQVPYLSPDPLGVKSWQQELAQDKAMKAGLVWWGRSKPDPSRSLRLAALTPLGEIRGISLYSLQVGTGSEQLAAAPFIVKDLTSKLKTFSDTAALIANLDLVITIDSAVAHLAGALGKPTWLLLPFAPDWRWGLERSTTPWYPTMRLFRQEQPGDWQGVVQRLTEALTDLAGTFG